MAQLTEPRTAVNPIPWRTTLDEALGEARRSGKFVLMDFFNPG